MVRLPQRNTQVEFLIQDSHRVRIFKNTAAEAQELSGPLAFVFGRCDGATSRKEVEKSLEVDFGVADGKEALSLALHELSERQLIIRDTMPTCYPFTSQEMGEENLVFVPQFDQAHLLDQTTARVHARCDGKTAMADVALELGENGEDLLWMSLETLADKDLIPRLPARPRTRSRREFLTQAGSAAALLPIITSVTLAAPAAAASSCVRDTGSTCPGLTNPPSQCTPCCDDGGTSNCMTSCATNCSSCFCMQQRRCPGNDCRVGTCAGDTVVSSTICIEDGTGVCDPGVGSGLNLCRRSCDAARADAAAAAALGAFFGYACCEGCS